MVDMERYSKARRARLRKLPLKQGKSPLNCRRTADRTKTKDLNRDIEKQPQSSDLNTRNDVVDIAEKEVGCLDLDGLCLLQYVLDDDEDWASHVSGNSAADDTLKKLEDIK